MPSTDWPRIVRAILASSGKTQNQLAEEIGVTQATLSRWLSGAMLPTEETREHILELARQHNVESD